MTHSGESLSFHDHFSSLAADYAEFRPNYPPELFAWLAAEIAPRACRGIVPAATVKPRRPRATFRACDRHRCQRGADRPAKPHDKVEYRVALAEASGLPRIRSIR